jgi:hypothetical protein
MYDPNRGYPLLRWIGFAILALTWGQFGIGLLVGLTMGAVAIPFVGLLILSPVILVNYLLWGGRLRALLEPGDPNPRSPEVGK